MPNLPTSAEAGMPEVLVGTWYGLFAPAAVKPEIVSLLNTEVMKFMNAPETRAHLAKVELDVKTGNLASTACEIFLPARTSRASRR